MAWLLLAPVLCVGVLAPPALGSYSAERAPTAPVIGNSVHMNYPALPTGVVSLSLAEYTGRALDPRATLKGHTLRLIGFVTPDVGGGWDLTRMAIACCAADAVAVRVGVDGADAPVTDRWVTVEGIWLPVTGVAGAGAVDAAPARIKAARVQLVEAPRQGYE